jgi:diguanylate cyclase (GGDEF)-like protein
MPQPSILIVDDDPASIQVLGRMLAEQGQLRFALSGAEGLRLAQEAPPDLLLLDADMPGLDGFEVCTRLKSDPVLADVPVIFVTSHSDTQTELAGLAAGAVDCISKPPQAPLVVARVRTQLRLKALTDELRRAALTDALTGVANRRRFDELLHREWQRAQRSTEPLSLAMIDIDHFKAYNDRLGHPAGDHCLRRIAEALRSVARRPADALARYGGEEFALLLPQTDTAGARHLGEALVQAVAEQHLPHPGTPNPAVPQAAGQAAGQAPGQGGEVSVSVGVATVRVSSPGRAAPGLPSAGSLGGWAGVTPADIVGAADQALYETKRQGRARCCSVLLTQTAAERVADRSAERAGERTLERPAERSAARAGDA